MSLTASRSIPTTARSSRNLATSECRVKVSKERISDICKSVKESPISSPDKVESFHHYVSHCVSRNFPHIINFDVPAGVGAHPLDTQPHHSIFLANILFNSVSQQLLTYSTQFLHTVVYIPEQATWN